LDYEIAMPRAARSKQLVPVVVPRRERFNLPNSLGVAIIGLLVSLIGTGIVSMISLYTRQATLTEQVNATSLQLNKHLDHSVDRDEYIRRDSEIQHAIEKMASKEELRELRRSIDSQTDMLREAISNRPRR
jgi:hypothetical protein